MLYSVTGEVLLNSAGYSVTEEELLYRRTINRYTKEELLHSAGYRTGCFGGNKLFLFTGKVNIDISLQEPD